MSRQQKPTSARKQAKAQEPEGNFYEVEAILDKRLTHSGLMYLIRWKDYPNQKDFTWEPIQHLTEVEDLVKEFNLKDQQRTEENTEEREKRSKKDGNTSEDETSDKGAVKKRGRRKGGKNKEKKAEMINIKQDESDAEESKPRRIEVKKNKETIRTRTNNPLPAPVEGIQVDKFWEKEGLELGRICRHFNEEGDLIFLVNLNKGDLVYGTVQLASEELRSICEEKVVNYMENWVRNDLIAKKAKEGKEHMEMENFWNNIA